MSSDRFLSIVIPAFNEEKRLGETLDRIAGYARENSIDSEILVVDDGSLDETSEIARKESLRHSNIRLVRNEENMGKGFSIRRGILASKGTLVLVTDADLSAPIEEFDTLFRVLREYDHDIVIGSRGIDSSKIEIKQPWLRRVMGKVFNRVVRSITKLPFKDTQCGFKLMVRQKVKPIIEIMKVDRFSYDVELLFLAHKFGLRIAEVPVVWRDSRATRVKMISDSFNMVWDVAKIRMDYRRGKYGEKKEEDYPKEDQETKERT